VRRNPSADSLFGPALLRTHGMVMTNTIDCGMLANHDALVFHRADVCIRCTGLQLDRRHNRSRRWNRSGRCERADL